MPHLAEVETQLSLKIKAANTAQCHTGHCHGIVNHIRKRLVGLIYCSAHLIIVQQGYS